MTQPSPEKDGFLVLNKPSGITSFEALNRLKRVFDTGRVGHTGTLDRFATGVLVALVGRYSRLSSFFTASEKTYLAGIRFGTETDTLDPEGRVIGQAPPPEAAALKSVLPSFLGDILQAPPAYSAVHIAGKRAYERALGGETVVPEPRPVRILGLELLDYSEGLALLRVACSKGTYIRSLARDIALACSSRAHLESLVREASGPFRIEDGLEPDAVEASSLKALDPELAGSLKLPPLFLAPGQESFFLRGAPLALGRFASVPTEDGIYSVFSQEGRLFGVIEKREGWFYYRAVLGTS